MDTFVSEEPQAIRCLDRRARVVLGLFAKKGAITASDVAAELGLSESTARNLLKDRTEDGWLEVADTS